MNVTVGHKIHVFDSHVHFCGSYPDGGTLGYQALRHGHTPKPEKEPLDEALINRSTFYKHYADKYDLAEQLVNRTFQQFKAILEKRFSASRSGEIFEAIHDTYETLGGQRELLFVPLEDPDGDHSLGEGHDRLSERDVYRRIWDAVSGR